MEVEYLTKPLSGDFIEAPAGKWPHRLQVEPMSDMDSKTGGRVQCRPGRTIHPCSTHPELAAQALSVSSSPHKHISTSTARMAAMGAEYRFK
jgi:hypothetical protein